MRGTGMALNLFFFTLVADLFVILFGNVLDSVHSEIYPHRVGLYLAIFVCSFYFIAGGIFVKVGINKSKLAVTSAASYTTLEEESES